MKYTIVTEDHAAKLSDTVNAMCEFGWKPQGGVSIAVIKEKYKDNYNYTFAQALVKE